MQHNGTLKKRFSLSAVVVEILYYYFNGDNLITGW